MPTFDSSGKRLKPFRPVEDFEEGIAPKRSGPTIFTQPKGKSMNIFSWLNNQVVLGLLRNVLMAAGAYLVTKGYLTAEQPPYQCCSWFVTERALSGLGTVGLAS